MRQETNLMELFNLTQIPMWKTVNSRFWTFVPELFSPKASLSLWSWFNHFPSQGVAGFSTFSMENVLVIEFWMNLGVDISMNLDLVWNCAVLDINSHGIIYWSKDHFILGLSIVRVFSRNWKRHKIARYFCSLNCFDSRYLHSSSKCKAQSSFLSKRSTEMVRTYTKLSHC